MARRRRRPIQGVKEYQAAAWYLARGYGAVIVAKILGVSPGSVRMWRERQGRERVLQRIRREVDRACRPPA